MDTSTDNQTMYALSLNAMTKHIFLDVTPVLAT